MTQQFGNLPESIRSQRSERNSHLCRRPLIGRHPVVRIAETRRKDATSGAVDQHRAKGLPRVIWTSQIRASAAQGSANTREPEVRHLLTK